MSNTDKTRRMLMNSMEKTKAGIRANQASAEPAAKKKTVARKKTTAKKTAAKKAPVKKTSARKPMAKPQAVTDPYQSKGRIWPD